MSNLISNSKFDSGPAATVTGVSGDSAKAFTIGWLQSFTASSGAPDYKRAALGNTDLPFPFSPQTAWALQVDLTQHGALAASPAAGDVGKVTQRLVNGVRNNAGQYLTVSFFAKAGVRGQAGVSVNANFGTGGSPSSQATLKTILLNLTTSWQQYSVTFFVPAGSTFGTNGDDYIEANIWFLAGSTSAAEAGAVISGSIQNLYLTDVVVDGGTSAAVSSQVVVSGGSSSSTGAVAASVVVDSVSGNDGSASRYGSPCKTLTKAKALAQSGDTILVLPGNYVESDLLKNGVNWHFLAGAIVTNVDVTPNFYGIFDDRSSGAVTCIISGDGQFRSTVDSGNGLSFGVVNITNGSTDIVFRAKELSVQGGFANSQAALVIKNCARCIVDVDRIYDPTVVFGTSGTSAAGGIYWEKGNCEIRCRVMQVEGYGIWGVDPGGSPNTSLYYQGHLIEANASAVYLLGHAATGNPNYRMWVSCLEIKAGQYGLGCSYAGKLYVDAQKLSASNTPGGGFPAIGLTGNATRGSSILWARISKISMAEGNWMTTTGTGGPWTGEAYVTCQQWEDTAALVSGFAFPAGTTGKIILFGGVAKVLNGKCFNILGGVVRIQNMVIDTSNTDTAANTPITVATNGVVIDRCTLIAGPTNGVSVAAAAAQTVKNYGSVANKAIDAVHVTVQVGAITVDANVA